MAKVVLEFGNNAEAKNIAEKTNSAQTKDISELQEWLKMNAK
jgi:uncharacterized protein (DUF305 family)